MKLFNDNGEHWKKLILSTRRWQETKPGTLCNKCKTPFSVRVQYCTYTDKGKDQTEFEWINSKCKCQTVVIYKHGATSIIPYDQYDKKKRLYDDFKNVKSDMSLRVK